MSRSVENPSPRCEKPLGIVPDIFCDRWVFVLIVSDEREPQVYKSTKPETWQQTWEYLTAAVTRRTWRDEVMPVLKECERGIYPPVLFVLCMVLNSRRRKEAD